MHGVIGLTHLLLDSPLTEMQRKYASLIERSADALVVVINDILDFSKIEAGKLELHVDTFDLHDLIQGVLASLAVSTQAKGLELSCTVDEQVPATVRGDAGRLRQILLNIIGNAVKFTESGRVTVAVRAGPPPRNEEPAAFPVTFSVTDTGIGIAPEALAGLFQAFAQADGSASRKYGGTGLGLAISQRLASLMDGNIDVRSTPGVGSTFDCTVLLRRA